MPCCSAPEINFHNCIEHRYCSTVANCSTIQSFDVGSYGQVIPFDMICSSIRRFVNCRREKSPVLPEFIRINAFCIRQLIRNLSQGLICSGPDWEAGDRFVISVQGISNPDMIGFPSYKGFDFIDFINGISDNVRSYYRTGYTKNPFRKSSDWYFKYSSNAANTDTFLDECRDWFVQRWIVSVIGIRCLLFSMTVLAFVPLDSVFLVSVFDTFSVTKFTVHFIP